MLKFGLYDVEQLTNGDYRCFLGGAKRISISLLGEIEELPDRDRYREEILAEFTDDRGAYKRTHKNRFKEFDRNAIELIKDHFCDAKGPIQLHDTGVSNAQTATDFFLKAVEDLPNIEYYASDYDPYVVIVKHKKLTLALSQKSGVPVEVTYPPFVFNTKQPESLRHYPLNHLIRWVLQRFVVPRVVAQYKKGLIDQVQTIGLFCPAAQALEVSDSRFHLGQHNLLEPSTLPCNLHCFRAMNVLNLNYFSSSQFQTILRHVHDALRPGGLFILGSNQESDSTVHGGIFEKVDCGFQLRLSSGHGAVIQDALHEFQSSR